MRIGGVPAFAGVRINWIKAEIMRIATYNINGIKARLPRLLEWLTETQPDILCLQELKTSDETFPEKDIRDIGYGCIRHGQKGFTGVAILARGEAPEEVRRGLRVEAEDREAAGQGKSGTITVDQGGGKLQTKK